MISIRGPGRSFCALGVDKPSYVFEPVTWIRTKETPFSSLLSSGGANCLINYRIASKEWAFPSGSFVNEYLVACCFPWMTCSCVLTREELKDAILTACFALPFWSNQVLYSLVCISIIQSLFGAGYIWMREREIFIGYKQEKNLQNLSNCKDVVEI